MRNLTGRISQLTGVLSEATAVGGYLRHIEKEIECNRTTGDFAARWLPMLESHKADWGKCFLSVVMRTQGRRPEALREALLCLYAQDDRDFEVLLIGHNLNKDQRALVDAILDEQDEEFRSQIRFLPFDEGNRTTPLNYGFAQANGEYIMIFDDDDLVMEDCISSYRAQAEKAPGTVLYRYTTAQEWRVVDTPTGIQGLRAQGAPAMKFCCDYDCVNQVQLNRCPPIGLAFPALAFRELGIIFDETLATTEDWDYLTRVAKYTGVSSINRVGAVYRLWTNAESSATVHQQAEWKRNYDIIQKKMDDMPLLLPEGSALKISALVEAMAQETPAIRAERLGYIARLEGEMKEAHSYIDKLESDMNTARSYIGDLENNMKDAHGYIGTLENNMTEARKYIGDLENELDGARKYIGRLESDMSGAHGYTGKLESDMSGAHSYAVRLEDEIVGIRQYSAKLEGEMTELRGYAGTLESQLSELRGYSDKQTAEADEMRAFINHQNQDIELLRARILELEQREHAMQQQAYFKMRRLGGRVLRKVGLKK